MNSLLLISRYKGEALNQFFLVKKVADTRQPMCIVHSRNFLLPSSFFLLPASFFLLYHQCPFVLSQTSPIQ